jgi:hypothetical protein
MYVVVTGNLPRKINNLLKGGTLSGGKNSRVGKETV